MPRGSRSGRGCVHVAAARQLGRMLRIVEVERHVLVQCALVALQRQHVGAASLDDPLGDGALAAHRVRGHDAALEREHLQQLRNGCDLVGSVIHRHLAQDQPCAAGPSRDEVQGRGFGGAVIRTAQRLAVHRDHALRGGFGLGRAGGQGEGEGEQGGESGALHGVSPFLGPRRRRVLSAGGAVGPARGHQGGASCPESRLKADRRCAETGPGVLSAPGKPPRRIFGIGKAARPRRRPGPWTPTQR